MLTFSDESLVLEAPSSGAKLAPQSSSVFHHLNQTSLRENPQVCFLYYSMYIIIPFGLIPTVSYSRMENKGLAVGISDGIVLAPKRGAYFRHAIIVGSLKRPPLRPSRRLMNSNRT
jgi:hypothetical protein